jgi:hypothetical protein
VGWSGNQTSPAAGTKIMYGWTMARGGNMIGYYGTDSAALTATTGLSAGSNDVSFTFGYVNRLDSSTTHNRDKTFAIIILNAEATATEMEALRVDWFSELLMADTSSGIAGTVTLDDTAASGGLLVSASLVTGTVTLDDIAASGSAQAAGNLMTGGVTLADTVATGGLGNGTATIVSQQFKSTETKLPLALTTLGRAVLLGLDGTVAANVPAPVTGSDARLTINSAGMTAGVDYMLAAWNVDGSLSGIQKVTAA